LLTAALGVAALASCNKVPAECTTLRDEASFPLGFTSYEQAGSSPEQWREDLTEALVDSINYTSGSTAPGPPRLIGESFIDGIHVLEYELASEGDGAMIPFVISIPPWAQGTIRKQFVMVLHGHGETAAAPFDEGSEMHNIGGRLLELGYVVASVEMRSFGVFKVDGKGHDDYIADLADGEYVGRVLADNVQVAKAVRELFAPEEIGTFSVFGHSFGGYIALHIGALYDWVDQTMSSGHFLPYGCVNTDLHDPCQDILAIEGLFEIYDTAGMIAPKGRVDLFFGEQDSLLTAAVYDAFERLEVIFDKLGAPGDATLTVSPSFGHEVDVEAVVASLPPLPG